jgi:hypothetical protein
VALGILALALATFAPFLHHHDLDHRDLPCPVCHAASYHGVVLTDGVPLPAVVDGALPALLDEAWTVGFAPYFALPDPRGPPQA